MASDVSVRWRLGLGLAEENPQLLDDRVVLVDEYQVIGIVDHVHLRVYRMVSADDRQDGMAAFGQLFDAMGSRMAELTAMPSPNVAFRRAVRSDHGQRRA